MPLVRRRVRHWRDVMGWEVGGGGRSNSWQDLVGGKASLGWLRVSGWWWWWWWWSLVTFFLFDQWRRVEPQEGCVGGLVMAAEGAGKIPCKLTSK